MLCLDPAAFAFIWSLLSSPLRCHTLALRNMQKNSHNMDPHVNHSRITPGGCGQSFEAVIVSTQFNKKTLLQRHRMVNSAIKDEVAAIHAWTPKCFTPEEFERKAGELQQQQQGGSVEGEKQRDGTMTTNWHTQSVSASESKGSVTEPVDGPSGVLDSVKKKIVG